MLTVNKQCHCAKCLFEEHYFAERFMLNVNWLTLSVVMLSVVNSQCRYAVSSFAMLMYA